MLNIPLFLADHTDRLIGIGLEHKRSRKDGTVCKGI